MRVGVPREIKVRENRVGLTPASVRELVHHGHQVVVEHDAGHGIGAADRDYEREGATVAATAADVYGGCDMIVKVKEPQPDERKLLRPGQILFTYLHLAPDPEQTSDLVASNAVCIGYETVTSASGGLPLLAPMSEVAGRLAVQAGAHYLEEPNGGKGMLLGGVPGVAAGSVVVVGGGVVVTHAIEIALGMGARVTVLDRSVDALSRLWAHYGAPLTTVFATAEAIERHVSNADLVVGAVLVPGASAPRIVTRAMIAKMQAGSVVVDVAIDQGGCFETSHPTTHESPTYVVDGVVHYCVANMPGAVPRTSTYALNNATLPFVLAIADKGWKRALADDPHLRAGLNVALGRITYRAVAEALEMRQRYASPESVIGA
ncbi:MAG TPA: alanine dehydrogenase [Casimicrobiaceae bacterium]|nr:alanine dehydrogenase [Casimicrobiaceae bacterium]